MSLLGSDLLPWSRRRWVVTGSFVFAVHLFAIVWFSDWSVRGPRAYENPTTVVLARPDFLGAEWDRWLRVADPSLMALPSPQGFSGQAWRRGSDLRRPEKEWEEPQRWLTGRGEWFTQSLNRTQKESVRYTHLAVRKPPPQISAVSVAMLPLIAESRVVLDPTLAARGFLRPLEVPLVTHSNVLPPTVVQVRVMPSGAVFSALVLQRSGLAAADDLALRLAESAWFQPEETEAPAGGGQPARWGTLTFQWRVVEAAKSAVPQGEAGL